MLNQSNTANCGPQTTQNTQNTQNIQNIPVLDHQGDPISNPTHTYPQYCEESALIYRDETGMELDSVTIPTSIVRAGYVDCLGIRLCDVYIGVYDTI